MLMLAVVTLICSTVLVLGRRAERVIVAKCDADRKASSAYTADLIKLDERRVDVEERGVTLKEKEFHKSAEKPGSPVQIPDDLQARIDSWGTSVDDGEDPFARDNERSVILAMFAEFGNWDTVRSKLAPREGLIQ